RLHSLARSSRINGGLPPVAPHADDDGAQSGEVRNAGYCVGLGRVEEAKLARARMERAEPGSARKIGDARCSRDDKSSTSASSGLPRSALGSCGSRVWTAPRSSK